MTIEKVIVVCPLVFMGCNWRIACDTAAEARAAEAAHWTKFHEGDEEEDE